MNKPGYILTLLSEGICRPLAIADVIGWHWDGWHWDDKEQRLVPDKDTVTLAWMRGNASRLDPHGQLTLNEPNALRLWRWDSERQKFVLEHWSMPP